MIIGISGKINAGKDLVGEIIQYLVAYNQAMYQHPITEEDLKSYHLPKNRKHYFEVKKFADKLKDIVCLLIGCTREQLEDREFKEKELGEEWRIKHQNWIKESELILEIGADRTIEDVLEDGSFEEIKSFIDSKERVFRATFMDKILTPRRILQLLGTEAGREIIHPNIWVNSLMSEYRRSVYNAEVKPKKGQSVSTIDAPYPNWIITDMRFPNELEAVKSKGGITIRVNRPTEVLDVDQLQHPSETALDNAEFDYTINNNGTIEELIEKVRQILIKGEVICK